ncbi:MAG: 50S ribosomal protein L6 [Deltaproteobacteria bacterium]|nr:50S ribosomal protein L6 [Deltaproteobacteria bacterium]
MSRVGKKPVVLDKGVDAKVAGSTVSLKGPKGELSLTYRSGVNVAVADGAVTVTRRSDHRNDRALHGLTRALIANMAVGVSKGYERKLEMIGVGYRAEVKGSELWLAVGFPKEKILKIPGGVAVSVEKGTTITLSGIDKESLGQFAAKVRRIRPPEPYKGKGIKYAEETIRRKVGKTSA